MEVRPFYIEADIDGRQTNLSGGPKNREGGMYATFYQRNEGSIDIAFKIKSWRRGDTLITQVMNNEGHVLAKYETQY